MSYGPLPGETRPEEVTANATPEGPTAGEVYGEQRSAWRRGMEVFAENRLAVLGFGILVLFLLFCFVGPLVYHTNQVSSSLITSNESPSSHHLLGTDTQGYDEIGRLMKGGQASLEVGIAAALVATIFGTLYGAVSGYIGGPVDAVLMRLVDGLYSIPPLFILLVLSTIYTPGRDVMIILIAFFYWLGVARLVRGESLSLRTREYVQAVKMMGGSNRRAVIRHIAPNAVGTVVVFATFSVADSILLLSFLGYLGLGLQAPDTDWGSMLSTATDFINSNYWWLLYPPGIAIILICIAFNFMGDALRDAFEVRLQSR